MTRTTKAEWLVPAVLLTLCAVPALAGAMREKNPISIDGKPSGISGSD